MPKDVYIHCSKEKKKSHLLPIKEGEVKIYLCGPTVYDDAHLGHARSAISFDLLVRVLRGCGYRVTFMRNFTDIDDKIINKSKITDTDIKTITNKYIDSYLLDMESLRVARPDIEPKATNNLQSMIDMISDLLQKDIAYQIPSGDIYLDVNRDKRYGEISKRVEDEDSVSRIEHEEHKRNRRDFALWKAIREEDEIGYDSPFGKGRPGWHIECSAMIDSFAYDGEYAIDIHAGGADLLFPHHENEGCQTRCAKEQEIAKYWMHNGFVTINGEKMSKSLKNSFFVKDALQSYSGEVIRFYLLSAHYRAPLSFNEEDLLSSKKRLDKLYRLKKRVLGSSRRIEDREFEESILEVLSDDLNTSKAFALIDEMVALTNEKLDRDPKDKESSLKTLSNMEFLGRVLGIGDSDPYEYFKFGIDSKDREIIENLISKRSEAKKEKNFKRADEIRDELKELGVELSDTPQGTLWEKSF